MKRSLFVLTAVSAIVAGAIAVTAQAPPAAPMTFFVTSVGSGNGANLGGLAGADALCQKLAGASGAPGAGGMMWRAYLSTQGANAVNARDRIGSGPWANIKGQVVAKDVAHLHGDTVELAQLGSNLSRQTVLTEKGEPIPGAGAPVNQHDILTGSTAAGRAFPAGEDRTCNNWTSGEAGSAQTRPLRQNGRRQRLMELRPSEQGMQPGESGVHGR